MKSKIQVSIIIVNYKVEKELISCIQSIVKSKPKVSYEIIVVDNDETSVLKSVLEEKFPQVLYIKSPRNVGFGAGNNLGAKISKGDFIFFLNPDTIVEKDSIDILFNFIVKDSNVGMVSPLLFDLKGHVYPYQGSDEYNLKSALVVFSFVNKIFPDNSISRKFFHKTWDKKDVEEFDVVPGTAFMIEKNLFRRVGMFDEKFFLYFEEYDLAKKIKKLGYKNYIVPKAKASHIWEASTKKRKDIDKIFSQSRYHFFKKHHGMFFALIINLISNVGKYELMLGLIVALSLFLGFFKIEELMVFIGDQGWFYLSAKDMLMEGEIPLVGIASSHPWLHQGAFWTYILAVSLAVFNFNPVSGAYLTIFIGLVTVVVMYLIGSLVFSKKVGIISALLYATSPLAVFYMRFPYHTSPVPIFVMGLIFSLYKIVQNKLIYLPISILLLGILYNFEIATVVLWPVVVGILGYKLLKREVSLKKFLNKKILCLSVISSIIPLLPMILYDVNNGFPQTLKFIAWIPYRILSFFTSNMTDEFSINKFILMFNFLFDNFTKLIFPSNNFVSLSILISIGSWIAHFLFKKKKINNSYCLVFLLFFIPLTLIILNQVPSDAYLPIFFPTGIIIFAIFLNSIINVKKMLIPILIFIAVTVLNNINFMFKNNFAFDNSSAMFSLEKRIQASRKVLNIVGNKDYNLKGQGPGSRHESFTANYEYLTWWLGNAPSVKQQNLKIYISEGAAGITVKQND